MKYSSVFLFYCFFYLSANAQNLVPNPSFEGYYTCPKTLADLYCCKDWRTTRGSCDYYNGCSNNLGYDNPLGYQLPEDSFAYAGLATFRKEPLNYREHMQAQLNTPLSIGTSYYISFYASPAFKGDGDGGYESNKLGVLFSTVQFDSAHNNSPVNNFAHFYTDSLIRDTGVWTHLRGYFTADSAYQYITIGNFFDDAHTDTFLIGNAYNISAYYYIDNVCVATDSLCSRSDGIHQINLQQDVRCFPNPAKEFCNITGLENGETDITLINEVGSKVFNSHFLNNVDSFHLTLEPYPKGFYSLLIVQGDKTSTIKLIIQ